ncbi:MAG: DUF5723 family protein, partial [Bacteroidales bacterium]|nr:DUF5723 family protein [Bacteroidales bacterium]
MKIYIQLVAFFFLIMVSSKLFSQMQSGAFTVTGAGYSTAVVTDYQCVGLNPANLGWKRNNHLMNIGIGESSISIYSEPLKRALVNDLFNANKTFNDTERQEAVNNFTDAKLQMEANVSGIGLSFQDEKIGGFGFTIRERLMWDSNLNEESADILFNGYNASYFDTLVVDFESGDTIGLSFNPKMVTELFEGTRLEVLWFREYNFSYGRSIINRDNFSIYGGIGIKYIEGYSVFNYTYKDGVLRAFSALNPTIGVDYDADSPSNIDNNEYQAVGKGWGLDFGLSVLLFKNIRIAVSLTDFGKINWDGNVYEGEGALLSDIETGGIDNYNIFELQETLSADDMKWGEWEGLDNKETELPVNFRAGASYLLKNKFEFGTELYLPMNEVAGAYDKVIVGLGTRISPVRWFRGSIGVVSGGATGT